MLLAAPVSAIIFDFDGVLADSEDLHFAAFQAVAADAHLALTHDEYYERLLGLPDRDCLAQVWKTRGRQLSATALDELAARKRATFARLSQSAALYQGVVPMLHLLHGHFTLAIASGAYRDEIEPVLEREGVDSLFAAVVGAEDVAAGKPAPDPFLQALRQMNRRKGLRLQPPDCVVIEDSPRGVAGARAAGMPCIAVTTSHDRSTLAAADVIVAHASALRPEDFGL